MKLVDKNPFIQEKCRGKSVIDLGCVCHDLSDEQIKQGIWLHGEIKKTAKDLVGYDFEKEEIEKLRKRGYNVHFANVEELDDYTQGVRYDTVVMGSIIEHLSNPGKTLDAIHHVCHEQTELIITTVNAWSPRYFISALIDKEERTCRPDHVSWYSHYVMDILLRRHGFQVTEKYFYNFYPLKMNGIRPFIKVMLKKLFPVLSHGIVVIARRTKG
ncbi:MAG TPA: methyltransferase domain-containing protein [Ohtaekwangia sp.]